MCKRSRIRGWESGDGIDELRRGPRGIDDALTLGTHFSKPKPLGRNMILRNQKQSGLPNLEHGVCAIA